MKRVTINKNEVGLVVKNNTVVRVLQEGKFWLGFGEKIQIYNLSNPFHVAHDIDMLLAMPAFQECVEVVEVADNEIALHYVNKNFKSVLPAGRHIFWKGLHAMHFEVYNIEGLEIPASINKQLYEKVPFSYQVRKFKVNPSEVGLLFVNGELQQELKAGTYYFWKNNLEVSVQLVDLRVLAMEIPGQEILTKDKAQVRINFAFQYQVIDVEQAVMNNKNFEVQLYTCMQFALRAYIGNLTLDSLMENKSAISEFVLAETKTRVSELGVKVITAGVKDIILPGEIRTIMNQVLIAEKQAQANIITRREETASTRSLLNTAKLLEENAMLFKLREMEYVEKIAEKINSISVSGNGQVIEQLKQLFVK